MTAVSPVVKPVSQLRLAPGSTVTIQDVSWEEFESILGELGEKRSARVAYSQSTLEIMVPLPEHEKPKDLLSDIVKILLENGHYLKSDHSPNFPHIPLTQIIPATVERSWQVGTVQALEEFAEQVDRIIL